MWIHKIHMGFLTNSDESVRLCRASQRICSDNYNPWLECFFVSFIPITVYTWLWYLGWDWWRSSFLVFTLTLVTPFGCLWFFEATEKSGSNGWNTFGNDAEASVWYKVHFGFMDDDIGWKNLTVTSLTSKLKLHHIYWTSGGPVLAGHFLVLAAAFW